MKPRLFVLPAVLLLACCGEPEPQMPTSTKTVPTVAERYQRRTLVTWRSLAGELPAEERAAQLWALSVLEQDPMASLDILLARLDDADPSVRLAAIVATGRLAPASPRAAEKLVALFEAPEEPLRRHARLAVGNLAGAAVEPLRQALASNNVRVRWAAVSAFRDVGPAGAAAADDLVRLSREDESASIRRQARFSLARLGRAGIEACVALMREADTTGRAELATALSVAGAAVVEPMAALLTDADEDLAARAAGVLADQGADALPALDALLEALRRPGPVRFNAAEALLRIGRPAFVRLTELAKSDDEGLAGIARYVLDQGRPPR